MAATAETKRLMSSKASQSSNLYQERRRKRDAIALVSVLKTRITEMQVQNEDDKAQLYGRVLMMPWGAFTMICSVFDQ